jgi:hypothetical protein
VFGLIYPYGIVLQVLAILHFVRRRPETYWLWIILMFGGVGALIYIVVEVIPDAGLLRGTFQVFPRRKRIKQLEAMVLDNPSVGNYEELGDLYLDDRQFARARECFDKVLARGSEIDPLYRRALCAIALNDYTAAEADLEKVVARDPKYDYLRAAGLRAQALATINQREKADALFAETLKVSTLSETQYNYACFLAAEGRHDEARELAEQILRKKATMPDYIRRRERPWFRKARALLKTLPRQSDSRAKAGS